MADDILKNIWNELSSKGKTNSEFDAWKTNMYDDEKVQTNVYGYLKDNGYTDSEFGDWKANALPAKTNDSASADPAVESNQNDTGSESEDGSSGFLSKAVDMLKSTIFLAPAAESIVEGVVDSKKAIEDSESNETGPSNPSQMYSVARGLKENPKGFFASSDVLGIPGAMNTVAKILVDDLIADGRETLLTLGMEGYSYLKEGRSATEEEKEIIAAAAKATGTYMDNALAITAPQLSRKGISKITEKLNEYIAVHDNTISEEILKGSKADWGEIGGRIFSGAITSAPYTLAALNPYTAAALSISISNDKFVEEYEKNPDKELWKIAGNAATTGGIEMIDALISRKMFKAKGLLKGKNFKGNAEKALNEMNKGIGRKIMDVVGLGAKESLTEMGQSIATKINDELWLGDSKNISEVYENSKSKIIEDAFEIMDEGIIGGFSGGGIASIASATQGSATLKARAEFLLMPAGERKAQKELFKKIVEKNNQIKVAKEGGNQKKADVLQGLNNDLIKSLQTISIKNQMVLDNLQGKDLMDYAKNVDKINILREGKNAQDVKNDINNLVSENQTIFDRVLKENFGENMAFTKAAAAQLNISEGLQILNSDSTYEQSIASSLGFKTFEDYIDAVYEEKVKQTPNITRGDVKRGLKGSNGVFIGKGVILINSKQSKKIGAVGVGSHEILHPILNALVGDAQTQKNIVLGFEKVLSREQASWVKQELKNQGKVEGTPEYYNEYITVFSEGLVKNRINFERNSFGKIKDWVTKTFIDKGFDNIDFVSGRGVYNFMKSYSESTKSGKLSRKTTEAIAKREKDKGVKVSEAETVSNEGQFSKTITEAEAALDAAMDADPDNPSYLDNIDKAEAELDAAEAAAKAPPTIVPKAKKEAAVVSKDTENIVLFDKSAVNKKARPEKPTRTTDLGPRDPISKKIMSTYNEDMEGIDRPEYKANKPLPASLERKLIPFFEGYINTIVQQKFKQFATEALEFQDALSILRAEVSNAIRTFNPAKNKDLAGYVKKIIQTRQSLMFKDANAEFAASLDDAKGVTATEDTQSIDRSGAVERGQATFDELDIVDDALIEDIKQDLEKEIRVRVQKGTLSETIDVKKGRETYTVSWLENYVNKQLFKKLSKKLGAIAGVYPDAVIPGAYIDFLNDPKTFDIITKALPIKSIKKSYSKLFPVKKVGREVTAEGNPVFKISKINKKEFLTYFVKGNKSTVLERQKQLFREILEPLAKQVVADYATPENLSELKSIQELAPDVSQDVQGGIIIDAQLNELQSQLDRYKGEKSTFDIIQFSQTVSVNQKANIQAALEPLLANVKNNEFKSSVIQDMLDGLESVNTFEDLAQLVWNSGTSILNVRSTREYRAEVLNLLANKLNYVDTVKFLIAAIKSNQRVYAYQLKTIGYNYALSNFKSGFENAKDDAAKGKIAELFLGYVSRSIRTLALNGITKNSQVYDSILKPILGDPTKYNFSLEIDEVKNRSYILKDEVRLQGLADVTQIKADFEGSVKTINKEAAEVRAWLLGEAKKAIKAKDTDAFIGFLSLLSADQRGPIRKMSTAGFAFEGLAVKDSILEHETEAKDIFIAWKEFLVDENEAKLSKVLDGAKINLVSKKFDKLLRKITKTTKSKELPKGLQGKDRYNDPRAIKFLQNVSIIQFSKTETEAAAGASKLNTEFNTIIQDVTGLDSSRKISSSKAAMLGSKKGRFKFFLPPSAEDFAGLLYKITGKKKQGEAHQAWFKKELFDPFAKGIQEFESYKQNAAAIIKELKKSIKDTPAGLGKVNKTGFTNDVAVRVYLWNKNGFDIPDLTTEEQTELVDFVNASPKLRKFARQLDKALNGYPEPQGTWIAGTVTTDAINKVNTLKRAEFLKEWQENADAIFTKDNLSKLKSQFGENYEEALKDILYRMKTGRNRPSGANKLTNTFLNWVNDSVGTIMFFNTRSALLQTLSIVNFINWGDNNPIEAAKAFSNQKQFWADFSMLFNSDFLKQRRSGLKLDVNADEIANAAETQTNKAKAAFAALLKAGFTPTQMADSFAIAMGGASFIRNRINKYVSEGMTKNAADEKAFLDFQEIAEETQQSSRPDRVSQQQASPLGRIILAFANTPMQYMRLSKKAFLDLKNGRGDAKTNITKIIYYTAVQNIIFSSLQAALFAMAFDDDEEAAENKKLRVANSMLDSVLRGAGIYGAIGSTIKNIIAEIYNQSTKDRPDYTVAAQRALSISPPIDSKMRKIMGAARAFSYKTTRDKMKGYGLDNPAYYAGGELVSAAFNLPLDRVIRKADNLRVAVDNDTKMWQSIALGLGYSQWDLGLIKNKKSKKKSGFGTTFKKSTSSFKSGFGNTFKRKK